MCSHSTRAKEGTSSPSGELLRRWRAYRAMPSLRATSEIFPSPSPTNRWACSSSLGVRGRELPLRGGRVSGPAVEGFQDLVHVGGFGKVVDRAQLHGLQGRGDAAVPREDHGAGGGVDLLEGFHQLKA